MLKNKYKHIFAGVAAASLLMIGLTACGSGNGASAEDKSIFSINGLEPASGYIPANANDQGAIKVMDLLFSGLVSYNHDGSVKNEVAESIKPNKDYQTWTITIAQDRKFSDGTPVKAENFVRAWKAGAAEKMKSVTALEAIKGAEEDGTGNLTGLETTGEWTFIVHLKRPIRDFPNRLGVNTFYPLPNSAFGTDGKVKIEFAQNPVGNGPYKIKKWVHNQEIQLTKANTYRGPRRAQNDGVVFKIYSKTDAAYNDLLSGRLDILDEIPDSMLKTFKKDLPNRTLSVSQANVQTLDIGYYSEHFTPGKEGTLRRQAISQAINREEIINTIFEDTKTKAVDFLPPNVLGYSDHLKDEDKLQFNPKAAKSAWDDANKISPWDGKLPIVYNADSNHQAWVEAVAHQLSNTLGVEAVAAPVPDFKTIISMQKEKSFKGPFRLGWTLGYPSAANLLLGRYSPLGSGNMMDYKNEKFVELVNKAQAAPSDEEAKKLYIQAQDLLVADMPSVPLWIPNANIGYSERVSNIATDWKGDVILEKVKVVK